ncbi:MAG: hypothetical protein ACF8SC_07325 [Phycisphaerales bacterium JB037]
MPIAHCLLCLLSLLPSPASAQGLNLQPTTTIDLGDRSFVAGLSRELNAEIEQRTRTLGDHPRDNLEPTDRAYLALRRASLRLMQASEPEIKLAGIVLAQERARIEQLLANLEDPRGIALFMATDLQSLADAPALTVEQVDRALQRALAQLLAEAPSDLDAPPPFTLWPIGGFGLAPAPPPDPAAFDPPDDQHARNILARLDAMATFPSLWLESERLRIALGEAAAIERSASSLPGPFADALRNALAPALAELADPERALEGARRIQRCRSWTDTILLVADRNEPAYRPLLDALERAAGTPFSMSGSALEEWAAPLGMLMIQGVGTEPVRELRPALRALEQRLDRAAGDLLAAMPAGLTDPTSMGLVAARRAYEQAWLDATHARAISELIAERDPRGRERVADRFNAAARTALALGQRLSSDADDAEALATLRVMGKQAATLNRLGNMPDLGDDLRAWSRDAINRFAQVWAGTGPREQAVLSTRIESLWWLANARAELARLPDPGAPLTVDPHRPVDLPHELIDQLRRDATADLAAATRALAENRDAEALVLLEEWYPRYAVLRLAAVVRLTRLVPEAMGRPVSPPSPQPSPLDRLFLLAKGPVVQPALARTRRDAAELSLVAFDLLSARQQNLLEPARQLERDLSRKAVSLLTMGSDSPLSREWAAPG